METGTTLPFPTTGTLTPSPQIIFGTPFTSAIPQTTAPFLAISEAIQSESSPLARAEWLKFFALFYNAESTAQSLFQTIESSYNCQSNLAQQQFQSRKKIAFTSVENGQVTPVQSPLLTQLVKDAGGEVATPRSLQDLKSVDILFDLSFVNYTEPYDMNKFRSRYGINDNSYPFLEKNLAGKLFRLDGLENDQGIDDYPRTSAVAPELLLAGMFVESVFDVSRISAPAAESNLLM